MQSYPTLDSILDVPSAYRAVLEFRLGVGAKGFLDDLKNLYSGLIREAV